MTLPSGTLTIFFSDIEGSTQLLQTLGADYAALLDEHNRVLRAAIESHNGHEVKTQGDSFFAVFERAHDAVQAAAQAQRALFEYSNAQKFPQGAVVRVRIGLHTGEPSRFEDDYSGLDVHRAARIASAGHGGQTLLSQTTRELVEGDLRVDIRLYDLGEHRLKDLARPIRLSQLLLDGLPRDFPTLRTLDAHPNNLPLQPTPLLGREKELQKAVEMTRRADVRLLSLLGPGGTGKTRLSLQIAAEVLHEYANGAWFVELAPVGDASLVPLAILQTLGVGETAGQDALQTLTQHLKDQQMLLVLDNFEQILEAASVVSSLLQKCPALKIVATSRAPLKIRGEQEFPVPPLALPIRKPPPTLEQVSQFAAVQLFIQRAQNVKPSFSVTAENAPAIAEICARLDGLPLAIELAAALVKLLSPQALLSRLEHSLNILTGGARDVSQRQQTLRGAIAWSHDLLDDNERKLFRRLGVFVGGATLEAIEAVCNANRDLGFEMLDGVCSLVDKSLLRQSESDDGEPRFWMLETIREYSIEELETSGEAEPLRHAHARFLAAFIEENEFDIATDRAKECRALFRAEIHNFRAAFEYSMCHDPVLALRLLGDFSFFLRTSGFANSVEEYSLRVLGANQNLASTTDDRNEIHALCKARLVMIMAIFDQGRYNELLEPTSELLEISTKSGELNFVFDALSVLTEYHKRLQQWEMAEQRLQEMLILVDNTEISGVRSRWNDPTIKANHKSYAYNAMAVLALDRGDLEKAETYAQQALDTLPRRDDLNALGALATFGRLAIRQHNWKKASGFFQEIVAMYDQTNDQSVSSGWTLHDMAKVALFENDADDAEKWTRRSIENLHEINATSFYNPTLRLVAWLLAKRECWPQVATLLAAEESERETLGWPPPEDWREQLDEMIPGARQHLGEEFEALWQRGQQMTARRAFEYSMQALNAP